MRKSILIALIALLSGFQLLNAVPARPGKFTVTQPDGTRITLRQHGDEWGHWLTNASGQMVRADEDGFYRVVPAAEAAAIRQQAVERRALRRQAQAQVRARRAVRANAGSPVAIGQKHFLVILVEFTNKSFVAGEGTNDAFTALLNEQGYSVNGATGSARDFYYDNSHGVFEPIFDVYGPVQLDTTYAYYGQNDSQGNDKRPEEAVIDGCRKLNEEIDFSRYDNDGDGEVDLVFMYYAGKGEADGGSSTTIWPHQWEISAAGQHIVLDGKVINSYACTSELSGNGKMCGIGTACHEFGHAMGLPDFYDTDYDDNGQAAGLFFFSTMDSGSYNNDGRTPPYFNIEERLLLGWLDRDEVIREFPKSGTYTLPSVDENIAYMTPTDQDGEYFLYECRGSNGWDAGLPANGLVVYHADKSDRKRGENQELSEADNLKWIQQLADWTSETPDSNEFLGSLKEDLGGSEVYVFTPKGKIVSLPAEATPIDFAYAVHTEVGHRTMGARVNGRLVPLDTKLENGDTVEILTSKSESAGPSRDWLSFTKSPKARNKIRQWFSKERRTEAVEEGRDELIRAMRKRNLPIGTLMTPEALVGIADELNFANADAVFAAIGDGQISTQNVISHLVRDAGSDEVDEEVEQEALPLKQVERTKKTTSSLGISVKGVGDIWVKLARCCMPVPGDKIIGFITRNQGVSVHRVDCQNMLELERRQPERVVDVQWTSTKGVFMVKIQVEALDRPHLLSDVTRVLSDHGVNIISGAISTGTDRVATSQFSFEMADPQHLNTLLAAVRKIEGVFDVYRITGAKDSAEPRLRKM